ncbi:MAG: cell division protein FtsA [Pseudarcicella sp.]|nr:cell division protein FtsA [Pseudarcicella sp.]MBP6410005.1 cell division protein FtsA [Pseudarcicella sp.]
MSEIIVGLDIGSKQVSVVAGRLDSIGMLEILALGKASTSGIVSKGVVLNVNDTINAVQEAIRQVENQANLHVRGVIASVAGTNITSQKHRAMVTRQTSGEEVTVTDVDQLANDAERTFVSQGNTIIHTLPQEYSVDTSTGIYEPVGISGIKLQAEFQVVTSPTMAWDKTKRCIERAIENIEIEGGLVFSPLAASLSVLSKEEKNSGVVLVDIGSGTTEIIIFYKKIARHIAVLPYAGDHITSDIEQGCNISKENAELLKVKFGNANPEEIAYEEIITMPAISGRKPKQVSTKNLCIVIQERLKEIAALVTAEIKKSGYENLLPSGIVITGGSSQLKGIEGLFEKVTGKEVRIGYPNENLGKSVTEEIKNPSYATVVGLVWNGFKAIDAREDKYKVLRKDAPPIIIKNDTLLGGNLSNKNKTKPDENEKKSGFSLFKAIKKLGGQIIGEDLGDSDKY